MINNLQRPVVIRHEKKIESSYGGLEGYLEGVKKVKAPVLLSNAKCMN